MFGAAKALFSTQTGDAIVKPSKAVAQLRVEHFVCEPQQLRYPSNLDFSHATFKLRDVTLLEAVPRGAVQSVNLNGNELTSLEIINRFQAAKVVVACANSLQVGGGLVLRMPKLVELDLGSNRLVAIPPLSELPNLQILRLQRNQIARNWGELAATAKSLQELDVSHNRLAWRQPTGEFEAAMGVLGSLKKLKELRLGGNPVSDTPALRYMVLSHSPKLQRLDGLAVSEHERAGRAGAGAHLSQVQSSMMVPACDSEDEDQYGRGSPGGARGGGARGGGSSNRGPLEEYMPRRDRRTEGADASAMVSLDALSATRRKPPSAGEAENVCARPAVLPMVPRGICSLELA